MNKLSSTFSILPVLLITILLSSCSLKISDKDERSKSSKKSVKKEAAVKKEKPKIEKKKKQVSYNYISTAAPSRHSLKNYTLYFVGHNDPMYIGLVEDNKVIDKEKKKELGTYECLDSDNVSNCGELLIHLDFKYRKKEVTQDTMRVTKINTDEFPVLFKDDLFAHADLYQIDFSIFDERKANYWVRVRDYRTEKISKSLYYKKSFVNLKTEDVIEVRELIVTSKLPTRLSLWTRNHDFDSQPRLGFTRNYKRYTQTNDFDDDTFLYQSCDFFSISGCKEVELTIEGLFNQIYSL